MGANNESSVDSPSSSSKRRPRILPEPCARRVRGVVCGGQVEVTSNYKTVHYLTDYSVKYRVHKCRRCGKRTEVPVVNRKYDPDTPQPLISEASQRLARDPYEGL